MFNHAHLLSLYAETPVHCGTGATFGAIDLPVQREKHTHLPVLPASSLKGVLRDAARQAGNGDKRIDEIFGPETDGDSHAGAISATDGRLLLFPVRASAGIFFWVTCPFILQRLARDLKLGGPKDLDWGGIVADEIGEQRALVQRVQTGVTEVVFEDDNYTLVPSEKVGLLVTSIKALLPNGPEYEFVKKRLETHLAVIADDDLVRFTTSQTDVVTRNKLNPRKTTTGDGGNMWVQEYVPSDALFYALLLATGSRKLDTKLTGGGQVLAAAKELAGKSSHLQIGGDETVGRGWMRTTWMGA